jgi:hypothetical protein
MKKDYGVALQVRPRAIKPVPMDLSGKEGSRVVLAAAKRVIVRHAKVIKALANR